MAAPMEEMEENILVQDDERWAFYSVLMVEKTATQSQINSAYKKLSLQFHPDKHVTPEAKKAAENLFHRIKRAKDVLSDPHLRSIYDAVGLKGLEEFENGQLVRKDMRSSKEIIEEYERLLEMKRFQEELSSYNPHATTTMSLDMCSVFEKGYYGADDDDNEEIRLLDQLASIDVRQMKLDQGFTSPIGQKDEVTIGAGLQTSYRNGRSNGNISANWKRIFPYNFIANTSLVLGSTPQLSCVVNKQLTKYSSVSCNAQCNAVQGMVIFGYGSSYNVQLSKRLRAELNIQMGLEEKLRCSLHYAHESISVSVSIQSGMTYFDSSPSPNLISVRIVKSFVEHDLKVKTGAVLSLTKYRWYAGFIKQFPARNAMLNTTLSLDSDSGVELNVSLRRGRQKFVFPILMSSYIEPTATAYGLLLPVVAYAAVKAVFILPYLRQQREAALEKKKEEEKERLAARRVAALDEVELMTYSVQQIIEQEESKSGLVIVKALYGKLQVIDQNEHSEEKVINVTIPLQHQVKDSALRVPSDVSKVSMPGFYDPCFGEDKSLYIRYKFHNKLHHTTLNDGDPISIPKQGHLMTGNNGS